MGYNDIKVLKNPGPVVKFVTDDRGTTDQSTGATIKPGEPIKKVIVSSRAYALNCATGDPEGAVDQFLGVSNNESSETSSDDGYVEVIMAKSDTILQGKATTTSNVNTAAKIDAFRGEQVCFTLSSTTYSINEDEGDDQDVHALMIVDGDPVNGTLDVLTLSIAGSAIDPM